MAPPAGPGAEKALGRPSSRQAGDPRDKEIAKLRKDKERLAGELDKARKVIEVQGKTLSTVGGPRHRQPAGRQRRDQVIDDAICELTPTVGVRVACAAVGESRARHYRRHPKSSPPIKPERVAAPQPRALANPEREEVRRVLNSPDHVDEAPATVYAKLLDEGVYLASVPTMYRILREHGEVGDR